MTKLHTGLITPLLASDSGSTAAWESFGPSMFVSDLSCLCPVKDKPVKDKPSAPVLFVSDLEWIPFKRRRRGAT